MDIYKPVEADEIEIIYTIKDDGEISKVTLTIEQIENGSLYGILHDTERYTCLAGDQDY